MRIYFKQLWSYIISNIVYLNILKNSKFDWIIKILILFLLKNNFEISYIIKIFINDIGEVREELKNFIIKDEELKKAIVNHLNSIDNDIKLKLVVLSIIIIIIIFRR